jgi:hypothetical protein
MTSTRTVARTGLRTLTLASHCMIVSPPELAAVAQLRRRLRHHPLSGGDPLRDCDETAFALSQLEHAFREPAVIDDERPGAGGRAGDRLLRNRDALVTREHEPRGCEHAGNQPWVAIVDDRF